MQYGDLIIIWGRNQADINNFPLADNIEVLLLKIPVMMCMMKKRKIGRFENNQTCLSKSTS